MTKKHALTACALCMVLNDRKAKSMPKCFEWHGKKPFTDNYLNISSSNVATTTTMTTILSKHIIEESTTWMVIINDDVNKSEVKRKRNFMQQPVNWMTDVRVS